MKLRTTSALAAVACAAALFAARPAAAQTGNPPQDGAPAATTTHQHHNRDVLTPEDWAGRHEDNAYALVRTLRPAWFRGGRGANSRAGRSAVVVYRDGVKMGGEYELRAISSASIREIRFYDAIAATQLFGVGHDGGAIVVNTQ
ncbi:MAG TPA: hypothetical protein VF771_14260 [Longimicrobiaceae bacterium]